MRRARSGKVTIAVSTVAVMLLTAGLTQATEKYWIAHEATLIVVATLHPRPIFPWLDGWHMTGRIDVDEVLFGAPPMHNIDYRFVCTYCQGWPPLRFPAPFREKGIWFLRPSVGKSWQPSAYFGFDALSMRADYENYIRLYKH